MSLTLILGYKWAHSIGLPPPIESVTIAVLSPVRPRAHNDGKA